MKVSGLQSLNRVIFCVKLKCNARLKSPSECSITLLDFVGEHPSHRISRFVHQLDGLEEAEPEIVSEILHPGETYHFLMIHSDDIRQSIP